MFELELRASPKGGRKIRGKFPYNKWAVLSDGGKTGRPVKESFAPGAFKFSLENTTNSPIHLLSGHSYDKPLASTDAGTLSFEDTPQWLAFEADITAEVERLNYVQEVLTLIGAGLSVGLSPGFRLPPERAVPRDQAEQVVSEGHDPARGMHNAIMRTLLHVILFELSIVTRPAYDDATVEARNWQSQRGVIRPTTSILRYR